MKTIIASILLIFSFAASADCYELLTANYSHDSKAYQLFEDAVDYKYDRGTTEFARAAVVALEAQLGCGMEASSKQLDGKANCAEVVPGVAMSRVCYVENHHGYFLVSVDMLENINIVYNRFD